MIALALVVLLTVLVFIGGLGGEFVWDDGLLISGNAYVQSFDHLKEVLTRGFWDLSGATYGIDEVYRQVYRPVVSLAFLVQYVLFEGNPTGFHVVSLVLHISCVVMVWAALRTRVPTRGEMGIAAAAGALLFAIHPSRVESVSWISGSTELWMGLFVFAGYLAWLRRDRHAAYVPLAALLFCLGVLSKETAIVVPAILLVEGFTKESRFSWKPWLVVTGMLTICLAFRFWMVPLKASGGQFSLFEAIRRAVGSLGYYVEMTAWPWVPSAQRAFRYSTCSGELPFARYALVVGAVFVLGLGAALLVSRGRLRRCPWLGDIAWFVLPLAPVVNVFDLHGQVFVAERFLYLPLFGVAALVVRGFEWALGQRIAISAVAVGAFSLVSVGWFATSRAHVDHFHDTRAMWEYHHAIEPENPQAITYMIAFRNGQGKPDEALELIEAGYQGAVERCNRALGLRFALMAASQVMDTTPDTDQRTLAAVRAMYDGIAEGKDLELNTDRVQIVFGLPDNAIEIVGSDVEYYALPRATSWMRTLDLEGARKQLEAILARHENDANAWSKLAIVHARLDRWDAAERALAQGLQKAPNALALERTRIVVDQARTLAARPTTQERERVLRNAQIQVLLGAPEAARRVLAPALEQSPTDVGFVLAYVRTMLADRQFDAAEATVRRAEELDPAQGGTWAKIRDAILAAKPPR